MIGFEKIYENLSSSLTKNKLHHAIVIAGNKGIGKFEFAKSFAKEILADDFEGNIFNHPDLKIVEKISGKKNISVDQIRSVTSFFHSTSAVSKKKIVIINAADDFNVSSSNAILKTLEEPNNGCHLILICNSVSRLLPTIKSRCQFYKVDNLSFAQFNESFYNLRPKFLPKLSDEEMKTLSLVTGNSPRMAFKIGEDLTLLYNGFLNSVNDNFLEPDFLKKISDKSADFNNILMIFDIFFNRLLQFYSDIENELLENEKNAFAIICKDNSIDQVFKTYDESKFALTRTISVNLDKKLTVINIFNRLVG